MLFNRYIYLSFQIYCSLLVMNCGTEMNARLPSVSVGRIEYMVYAFISMASSVLLMLDP